MSFKVATLRSECNNEVWIITALLTAAFIWSLLLNYKTLNMNGKGCKSKLILKFIRANESRGANAMILFQ
jgi:dolichol kinase